VGLTRTELWHRAQKVIPGGVNSPVRAMRGVGLDEPFFVRRGDGATLETADGRTLLDWVQSWGPLIFGHADAETVEAVREAARNARSTWRRRSSTPCRRSKWCDSSRRAPKPRCRRCVSRAGSRTVIA
jgi:glutamate-1-semialdehyde aminotransferase